MILVAREDQRWILVVRREPLYGSLGWDWISGLLPDTLKAKL
jgi:hypothetical protein